MQTGSKLMTHAIVALVVVGCLVTLGSSCALRNDAAVTAKVKSKLIADPQVNPFEIDVDTEDGVVRLSGMVEDPADREEAQRLAEATKGVQRVINDIKIGDPTPGEVVSDTWIESKVKSKLTADPEVNPFNIDVDVIKGVVTLSGRVEDQATCDAAIRLAKNTKGVVRVENRIEVAK